MTCFSTSVCPVQESSKASEVTQVNCALADVDRQNALQTKTGELLGGGHQETM